MTYQSAERVATSEGRQYHIGVGPGELAEHILLVGDPERADMVAKRFDSVRVSASHRDYRVHTGVHEGLELSVMCTGMGAGCMEIAVVEICQIVERPTLVRAGSCGALQPDIHMGDLVITQGALRMERASLGHVDEGYPAYAHAEAQIALVRAAEEHGARYHVGVTATAAGFYGAQARNVPHFAPRDPELTEKLARQGVKNLEMEASCLLTLAAVRGIRAGTVCAVYASRTENVFIDEAAMHKAESDLVSVALRSLHHLARMQRVAAGRPHWHDGLERA